MKIKVLLVSALCLTLCSLEARGYRDYVPKRTCSIGREYKDTGVDIDGADSLDSTKFLTSSRQTSARACAHKCCQRSGCSLSWYIRVDGEEDANCFLLNCEAPNECHMKVTGLRDSITYVHRKRRTTASTRPPTTAKASPLAPIVEAVESGEELRTDQLKALLGSVGSLDDDDQAKLSRLIDRMLGNYGESTRKTTTKATTSQSEEEDWDKKTEGSESTSDDQASYLIPSVSFSTATPMTTTATATTTTITTTTTTTTTTTEPTTTTTTTTEPTTTTTTQRPVSSTKDEKTATDSKTAKTKDAKNTNSTKKSEKETSTAAGVEDDRESDEGSSSRPSWMQPRGGTAASSPQKILGKEQLEPPPVHAGLLLAASIFGVIATLLTILLMHGRIRKAWRRKDYVDADYLINGMYQPNI